MPLGSGLPRGVKCIAVLLVFYWLFSPLNASAGPVLSLGKTVIPTNQNIKVSYSGFPGNKQDWISIAKASQPDDKYLHHFNLQTHRSGVHTFPHLAPGDYHVRAYLNWPSGGYKVVHRISFSVKAASPVLSLPKTVFKTNEPITVSYKGFNGFDKDWVSIAKASQPDDKYLQYFHTKTKRSGSHTFSPLPPGGYHVRAYNNWPRGGYKVVYRISFSVKAASPVLTLPKTVFKTNEPITVSYKGFNGFDKDWVSIAKASQPDDKYLQYFHTKTKRSGSHTFKPLPPGDYHARAYNNWPRGGHKVVYRKSFSVKAATPVLTLPKTVFETNEPIKVNYKGFNGFDKDWVSIAKASQPDDQHLQYFHTKTKRNGSYTFKPLPPGDYHARAYNNWPSGGYKVVFRKSFSVKAATPVLTIPKTVFKSNEAVTVGYKGFHGFDKDWVSIAKASQPDDQHVQYFHTKTKRSGSHSFKPLPPGDYQVRAYNNWPSGGYKVVFRKSFSVVKGEAAVSPPKPAAAPPAQPVKPTPTPSAGPVSPPPAGKPVLAMSQPVYKPGQKIEVRFSGFPGNQKDWITVTPAGKPDTQYGQWAYLSGRKKGALSFKPLPPGEYQARAYLNWPAGGYKVAVRAGFKVDDKEQDIDYGAGISLRPTKQIYRPDEPIVVHASGLPRAMTTYISIGRAGAPKISASQSIKTNGAAKGTFSFKPKDQGKYRIMVWPHPKKLGYSIIASVNVEVKAPPLEAEVVQFQPEYNTGHKAYKLSVRPKALVAYPAVLAAAPAGSPTGKEGEKQSRIIKRFGGLRTFVQNFTVNLAFEPGDYEWRLYEPDISGRLVTKTPFKVVPLGPDTPKPADMINLPLWDRFNPAAACWRTEGLDARLKDGKLVVNTSRAPLRTAFSVPFEEIMVGMSFKLDKGALWLKWGGQTGQGYSLWLNADGPGARIYGAGGKLNLASSNESLIKPGKWHRIHLRRNENELSLMIDGKKVLETFSARRYKGGAPLLISGGDNLAVSQVDIFGSGQSEGGKTTQKWNPLRCRCGARVLEQWVGRTHGWEMRGNYQKSPQYKSETLKKLTKTGYVAMKFTAEGDGKGGCSAKSWRKVFKIGAANSSKAYLETYLIFGQDGGKVNFPHIQVELMDDAGKVLGSQRYYAPEMVSPASLQQAQAKKYTALPHQAGLMRLELKHAGNNIEFSQIALSIQNYVCIGSNEITIDQIVFCPEGQCGINQDEVIDLEQMLTEIERYLFDYRITADRVARRYLEAPKVEPYLLPLIPPQPASSKYMELPRWMNILTVPCAHAASKTVNKDCYKALDETVANMRRLKVTLGHDNKLGEAVKEMLIASVKDLNLGFTNIAKLQQDVIGPTLDNIMWSYDLAGEISDGKNKEAEKRVIEKFSVAVFKKLGGKLLSRLDAKQDLSAYNKTVRTAWAKALRKIKDKKLRQYHLARLKEVMGSKLSDKKFMEWIFQEGGGLDKASSGAEYIKKVGEETASVPGSQGALPPTGKLAGYEGAVYTLLNTPLLMFSANARLAQAGGKLVYESMRAARDWVNDKSTQQLYEVYKKHYDKGAGAKDFYNAFANETKINKPELTVLLKTKQLMMSQGIKAPISNAKAEKYLFGMFEKWKKDEEAGGKQADYMDKIKNDFISLDPACRRKLEDKIWPGGLSRWQEFRKTGWLEYGGRKWEELSNWRRACFFDQESFKKYAELRHKIKAELENWGLRGGKDSCRGEEFYNARSKSLTCRLLEDGEFAYKDSLARTLEQCKLIKQPTKAVQDANYERINYRLSRMSQSRLRALLKAMGREDLLNCLCHRKATVGSGGHYQPKKVSDCGGKGLCIAGNLGCFRYPVPSGGKDLKACANISKEVYRWFQARQRVRMLK